MITIIDENNLVTEDGVELVAETFLHGGINGFCHGCSVLDENSLVCTDASAPCEIGQRSDGRDVIFVEKNPC